MLPPNGKKEKEKEKKNSKNKDKHMKEKSKFGVNKCDSTNHIGGGFLGLVFPWQG